MLSAGAISLPATYKTARIGGEVVEEIVVERDGSVRGARLVGATFDALVPFAENSLQHSRFSAASIEGNPVAARCVVSTVVGALERMGVPPSFSILRVFVPGGESREARWQLAGSVRRLTLSARIAAPIAEATRLLARAPNGAERSLVTIPASSAAQQLQRTVKTGGFFASPGDYRLEIRQGDKTIASTTFTVASDFTTAVVNVCEPLATVAPR
jgi:hypothetical protein